MNLISPRFCARRWAFSERASPLACLEPGFRPTHRDLKPRAKRLSAASRGCSCRVLGSSALTWLLPPPLADSARPGSPGLRGLGSASPRAAARARPGPAGARGPRPTWEGGGELQRGAGRWRAGVRGPGEEPARRGRLKSRQLSIKAAALAGGRGNAGERSAVHPG